MVTSVATGSLAEAAGFKVGDTILTLASPVWGADPIPVEQPADLRAGRNLLSVLVLGGETCTIMVARSKYIPRNHSSRFAAKKPNDTNGGQTRIYPMNAPPVVVFR